MLNINISVRKNQVNNLSVSEFIKQVVNDCAEWRDSSRAKLKVFAEVVRFFAMYGGKAMPSQQRIAALTGYSLRWVHKTIKELFDNGWIKKTYRHRKTCIYGIHKIFLDQDVSWAIKEFAPAIKILYYFKLPKWLKDIKAKVSKVCVPISKDIYINNKYTSKKGSGAMISETELQYGMKKAYDAAQKKIQIQLKENESIRQKRDATINESIFLKQSLLHKQLQQDPDNPFNKYLIGALC